VYLHYRKAFFEHHDAFIDIMSPRAIRSCQLLPYAAFQVSVFAVIVGALRMRSTINIEFLSFFDLVV
jgi:hypothetical protein